MTVGLTGIYRSAEREAKRLELTTLEVLASWHRSGLIAGSEYMVLADEIIAGEHDAAAVAA